MGGLGGEEAVEVVGVGGHEVSGAEWEQVIGC